ncbi:BspA family leucine-rich repeat surface protein [Vibrio sp. 1CM23M]|uniref:BspA family leucine-rich repeat surface protein n=1 Tax=Vibrio sp. 1CM23M TaxID=2929164 RepID=UPI0020BFBDA2|nr:BspA family leucine-rich repeat surface protein [Vibrio sp. 1CM23M]MCK8072420.1 BspA family leucine-rich repeat surface protein [Vibrio sp. 1CM23M]
MKMKALKTILIISLAGCGEEQSIKVDLNDSCESNPITRNQLLKLVNNYNDSPSPITIRAVEKACVGRIENFSSAFENSSFNGNLKEWDLSNAKNLSKMFKNAQKFEGKGLEHWNVSNVENAYSMFTNASLFDGEISPWNTKSLVDASWMFSKTIVFNQPIGNWDTSQVRDMSSMFSFTHSFNQDLNWDTSSVFSFANMFFGSQKFNGDVSGFEVKQAADMSFMFSGAASFNQNIDHWNIESVMDTRLYLNGSSMKNK